MNHSSSKWKGGKDSASKLRNVCWNCGEMGHFRDKCPEPVESSDEEGGVKEASGVNAAESEWSSEPEEAWEEDDKWNPGTELPADFVVENFFVENLDVAPSVFYPAVDNAVSAMINGYWRTLRCSISCGCDLGKAPDVGYCPIFFDILDEKGFSAHLSNIGHNDQLVKGLAKGRGMGMGCLSRSMSRVRLMLRPKYLPWIVSTTDTTPQLVAQEVEKGFVESTSSGCPVIDKSWVDRLSPCEVPFGGNLDLLAVREWAEKLWEDLGEETGGDLFLF